MHISQGEHSTHFEIKNVAKAIKKVFPFYSSQTSSEKTSMPQVAKPTKIEPGILSCLTSLNIDDVSQYKEKETPTPSGIAECKMNIMKMLDDSVSSKPIMQKTAESTNCKNSNKERTSFSTYIKQNSFNDTSNMYFNMNVNMNVDIDVDIDVNVIRDINQY